MDKFCIKRICTFLVFLNYTFKIKIKITLFNLHILHIWNGLVNGFLKFIFYQFLGIFFANIFTIKLDFANKNQNFAFFLQILKVEHKSFQMIYNLSYLNIKHGIKRGWPPPQNVSWFSSTMAGLGLTRLFVKTERV